MNTNSELERIVHDWLDATAVEPSRTVLADALDRVASLPQPRRRWLGRWLERGRGATRGAAAQGHDDNDRRDRLMFSATTVAAGVTTLVLAALLVAPRGGPGPGGLPAAEASPSPTQVSLMPSEAVVVTAKQECGDFTMTGIRTIECTLTASDPRVTGTLTMAYSYDLSTPNDAGAGVSMWPATLQGPEGTWSGPVYIAWDIPGGGPPDVMAVLIGDGAYQGWTYVYAADITNPSGVEWDSLGTLYPGAPPPPWEMPAASE